VSDVRQQSSSGVVVGISAKKGKQIEPSAPNSELLRDDSLFLLVATASAWERWQLRILCDLLS
jgi:hypothetical protein